MEDRLKNIFAVTFNVDIESVNNNSSPDNIEGWDSLNHSILIMALEQEFNVSFTPDEMVEMLNFELIKLVLQEKLK